MKICKYCGTENEEDFIRKNGGVGINVCTKCNSENLSGLNNHMFGKKRPLDWCIKQSELLSDGRMKGEKHPLYGKHHSLDHCLKISKSEKYNKKEFQEKYHLLCLVEEFRELPEDNWAVGMSDKQFRCKKCNEWFTPTRRMIDNRNYALKHNIDGCYFYCSDECKNSCPLFGMKPTILNSSLSIPLPHEYQIFRKEVLNRQLISENIKINHCEKCNSAENLNVHHEHPVKTHPHLALDPDNGIILCKECHYKFGHRNECSTGSLANKICK